MTMRVFPILILPVLAACESMPAVFAPAPAAEPVAAPVETAPPPPPPEEIVEVVSAPPPPPAARTAAELDTTTEAQKEAAREGAKATEGQALGTTIASLGDPTEPGLWLKTPLVNESRAGKIETEGGESALVQLIPLDGLPGPAARCPSRRSRRWGCR